MIATMASPTDMDILRVHLLRRRTRDRRRGDRAVLYISDVGLQPVLPITTGAPTFDELLSDEFETLPGHPGDADRAANRLAAWCKSAIVRRLGTFSSPAGAGRIFGRPCSRPVRERPSSTFRVARFRRRGMGPCRVHRRCRPLGSVRRRLPVRALVLTVDPHRRGPSVGLARRIHLGPPAAVGPKLSAAEAARRRQRVVCARAV